MGRVSAKWIWRRGNKTNPTPNPNPNPNPNPYWRKERKQKSELKVAEIKEWKYEREKERKEKELAQRKISANINLERRRINAEYLVKHGLWNEGLSLPEMPEPKLYPSCDSGFGSLEKPNLSLSLRLIPMKV